MKKLLFLTLFLFLSATNALAITQGTYTIGAAGDYATIALFEAAIESQLTGDLTAEHLDEETTISSIVTFATDTNSYLLKITAQSGAEHNGTFGNETHQSGDGARITCTNSDEIDFSDANLDDAEISNLVIDARGWANDGIIVSQGGTSGNILINRNIIKGDASSSWNDYGIFSGVNATNVTITNNIVYDISNSGSSGGISWSAAGTPTIEIYNNTCIDNFRNFRNTFWSASKEVNITLKNNIAQGGLSSDYDINSPGTTANNISEDTTSPDTSYREKEVVFADEAKDDFHLSSSDTVARDAGTDLSSEGFSNDIDGDTRDLSGLGWDIGADETGSPIYRSVAPNKTTFVDDDNSQGETLTISGSTATFNTAGVSNGVGVGDVILYDSDNDNDLDGSDSIVFIHARTDSQNFTVKEDDGAAPSTTTTANDKWAIYRAHTSLSNAEAGTENSTLSGLGFSFNGGNRNLLTNGEQWNIACYANGTTADSTTVYIENWITGPQNYIKIYTPVSSSEVGTSQRHKGKWDENKYRLEITTSGGIWDYVPYVRIDGLQIQISPPVSWRYGIRVDFSMETDTRISNNIIKQANAQADSFGVMINNTQMSGMVKVFNNIVYDFIASNCEGIINYNSGNAVSYIYNNTVFYSTTGFSKASGSAILKNNIAQNCPNGYDGTFDDSSDYNISTTSQQDADDVNDTFNGYKTVAFVSTTSGLENLHLAAYDTSAKDAGTSLVSDSYLAFNDDIDGQTRNPDGAGWDIGADEYTEALKLQGLIFEGVKF